MDPLEYRDKNGRLFQPKDMTEFIIAHAFRNGSILTAKFQHIHLFQNIYEQE